MVINNEQAHKFFLEQGITHLFHANTLGTSCTFINAGGLLSRGCVERNGLFQTVQSSDTADKTFDVWNDIFLDSADLHSLFNRINFYGPVLFKIKVDILLSENLPELYVTKSNPRDWTVQETKNDHYFTNFDAFKRVYKPGKSFQEMLTLKNTFSPLPFEGYLEEIILDNPQRSLMINSAYKDVYQESYTILKNCMDNSPYNYNNVNITTRNCWPFCNCDDMYQETFESTIRKLFLKRALITNT